MTSELLAAAAEIAERESIGAESVTDSVNMKTLPPRIADGNAAVKQWREMYESVQQTNQAILKKVARYERAFSEWAKGCSCVEVCKPWQCQDCTEAYFKSLAGLPLPPEATEPVKCAACGGNWSIKSDTSPCFTTCPTCNGMGVSK